MRQTLGTVFEAIAQENVAGVACVVRRSEAIRVKSNQPSGPSYIYYTLALVDRRQDAVSSSMECRCCIKALEKPLFLEQVRRFPTITVLRFIPR